MQAEMDELRPSASASGGVSSFSAEAHSWILVEEEYSRGDATPQGHATSSSHILDPDLDELPIPPLCDEDVAALAVSEVLAATWPLPLERQQSLAASDLIAGHGGLAVSDLIAGHGAARGWGHGSEPEVSPTWGEGGRDAPSTFGGEPDESQDLPLPLCCATPTEEDAFALRACEAEDEAARALPPLHTEVMPECDFLPELSPAKPAMQASALCDGVLDKARRSLRARPTLVLASLIASHAAVLLVGVFLGHHMAIRSSSSEQSFNDSCSMLVRRFSSGPTGMHARLCSA